MRRLSALFLACIMLYALPARADRYEFDKAHTNIMFYVNHLGFSDMVGLFTRFDGSFTFDRDHPEQSTVDVTLWPAGIRTSSELLDRKLQDNDFFNSDRFPTIHFVSTAIKITGKDSGDVIGNVTMLGVTKPAVLHVHLNKADYQPVTNLFVAGFKAEATIKRSDFGMNSYIPMVGDEVRLEVYTEGVNQDRKQAEGTKH
jgi:polyisoprenoid-binding protein YceI